MPGSSSWMPYAPQGVKGFDDMFSICASLSIQVTVGNMKTIYYMFLSMQGY